MRHIPLSLLFAITCMACSDQDIHIGLEKVDSQKNSAVGTDKKKSIYLEFNNAESNKVLLSSMEQVNVEEIVKEERAEAETVEETKEQQYGELIEEFFRQVKNQNPTSDSTTGETLVKQLETSLTEVDDTLPLKNNSTQISTNNSNNDLPSIPGATSFKQSPDGFGFTMDLSGDYLFEFDQDILTAKAKVALESVMKIYKQYDGIDIEVAGHTDSKGSSSYNLALSQRRANAVKRWFELEEIDATLITAAGYGEAQPVAPNTKNDKDYLDDRTLNRRVNITVKTKIKLPTQ